MKIVINIDEDYYEIIKHYVKVNRDVFKPYTIIANGTPLPKGHGRLIDADELKILIPTIETEYKYVHRLIDEAPTIVETDKGETE